MSPHHSAGEDGVPLEAAIRLVKLAYNYELWDTFDALLDPLLEQIKVGGGGCCIVQKDNYRYNEQE